MMIKIFISGFIILFFSINILAQDFQVKIAENEIQRKELVKKIDSINSVTDLLKLQRDLEQLKNIGLPKIDSTQNLIEHSALIMVYNEDHEQADWVAHKISTDIIIGNVGRTNDFREDPLVITGTAVKADYWNTGFDRGHLAPSADFRWSGKALSESYFYSNMSPQRPELNREIWADLENALRRYVVNKNEPLFVVTGPYFSATPKTIGENNVSIPQYFFKTALDYSGDTLAAAAFLIPNKKCDYPVLYYAMSIDSLESIIGIDFYAQLPDSIENIIERNYNYANWKFIVGTNSYLPIHRNKLPKTTINTVQARSYYDKKATVCGTVASTRKSAKGHIFLNIDGQFPDQLFWCTIWKSEQVNFSYNPEKELINKKICVKGIVKKKYGKPSMSLNNEKDITMYDDLMFNEQKKE